MKFKIRNFIEYISDRMLLWRFDRPLPPIRQRDEELIRELRCEFEKLPKMNTANVSPAEHAWINRVNSLRELVLHGNPRNFLRWDIIRRSMFAINEEYLLKEFNSPRNLSEWENRWREAIKESPVGHPIPFYCYPNSSGNLIHHAYHLAQFEEKINMRVNSFSNIFEFGGGYGSMCRLILNLGFQGKYIIFDLPAFTSLQKFYLESIGVKVHTLESLNNAENGVVCLSDLEQLKSVISNKNSIFIATWSISETDIDFRENILPLVSRFKAFLIAYQGEFKEIDNVEFFRKWQAIQNEIEWHSMPIQHLKNNYYLFGKII